MTRSPDEERLGDNQPLDLEALIADLEIKLERLKALYEQYFLGFERAEPLVPRKQVMRGFATLQREPIRNTALRFRYQTLLQRWNLLQARWSKTLREIEQGTYAREIARAERRGAILPDELLLPTGRRRTASPTLPAPADEKTVEQDDFAAMVRELAEDTLDDEARDEDQLERITVAPPAKRR